MDRLACINFPALGLQLALNRFPPDPHLPVALVKEDRPSSLILNLNRRAKELGLRLGMGYGEALSIVGDLRAVVVTDQELEGARKVIREILLNWSPNLESCPFDPGTFWVGTSGLTGLFGNEARWGTGVRRALAQARFRAFVVVGHTREGTYLVARHRRRSTILPSAEAETRSLLAVPLDLVPLEARHRRRLLALGIKTWGALSNLPQPEVAKRFGPDLLRDIRKIQSLGSVPLQTLVPTEPVRKGVKVEYGVRDLPSLWPLLEEPLRSGLSELEKRGRLLAELVLEFVFENHEVLSETVSPARPTTSFPTLGRLVGLRLERLLLPSSVFEVRLRFKEVAGALASGDLFTMPVVRDLKKGEEALALIRAHLGNKAVVRPVLGNSHLPGDSYQWIPVDRLQVPQARGQTTNSLVRRIGFDPGQKQDPVAGKRIAGPFRLQLATGNGKVDRDYWFLSDFRHEVHWIFWDHLNKQSGWEGVVD